MKSGKTTRSWQVVMGAVPIVFGSVAVAQVKADVRGDRSVTRVGPEVSVNGVTVEEYRARQVQLHNRLTAAMPVKATDTPVRIELTQQDRADLAAPWQSGTPLRIGVVKVIADISVNGMPRGQVFKQGGKATVGVYEDTEDGGFVWAMTVTSPGAQAIRVRFRNFSLPDNAEMFFFNLEGQVDGPYVGTGRNGTGDFWTRAVSSDTGVILLRHVGAATRADLQRVSFVISDLGHISGRRPPLPNPQSHDSWPCSDNASCIVDAECVNGTPADAAKDAIAKMEWIRGVFIFTCSGGLIADTDASTQIPLFLTANHCVSKNTSNLETFFFYTTTSCNGACPDSLVTGGTPPAPSTIGFTVLASGREGDFTLGQLNQSPPGGTTFLGWNNSPIAFTEGADLYRISNPNFGPQVFSHHQVDTGTGTCNGLPRGEIIYSADHHGATDGGSSGAPVVNGAGEIVGQLFGCCGFGCEVCVGAPTNATIDGALAFYFDNVAQYLDPLGGCTSDPECDDGNACNGLETCVSGSCQSGTPVNCGDGDACTADSCDPGTGACSNDPISCDDGDSCTTDSCDPATGCANTFPACGPADGCCGPGCDLSNDPDCDCLGVGASCVDDAECCSNKCKGRPGSKTCK